MIIPRETTQDFTELHQLVCKDLELNTPPDLPGDLPLTVGFDELRQIIDALPSEYTDYVLRLLPNRSNNPDMYDGRLVAVLSTIIIRRRLETPLSDDELIDLLVFMA